MALNYSHDGSVCDYAVPLGTFWYLASVLGGVAFISCGKAEGSELATVAFSYLGLLAYIAQENHFVN